MKLHRYLSVLPLVALLIGCAGSKTAMQSGKPDLALSTNNSLLWQVYGNGLQQPSYLYGTIHAIPAGDYFLGKNVEKKLKSCGQLIMELDLNHVDVAALARLSLLPDEKTVKDFVSESDYAVIRKFMADSIGISTYNFDNAYSRFKPFYLEQFLYFKEIGQDRVAYEEVFQEMAEDRKMPVKGLETMEEQLALIDTIPLDVQFSSLVDAISNYGREAGRLRKLIQDYKKQDLSALEQAFLEEQAADASYMIDILLNHRNSSWVPKLDGWMHDMPSFIAVGAGHLGGSKGLIQLLRNKGYTVEPISIE